MLTFTVHVRTSSANYLYQAIAASSSDCALQAIERFGIAYIRVKAGG